MIKKICPYPFSRIEFNPDYYIPCCFDWLTDEYRQLDHSGEDKWNSPAALELRSRILKDDYSLCKREYCKTQLMPLDQGQVENSDYILDDERLNHLSFEKTFNLGPSSISITADRRCNLACESCRPSKVSKLSPSDQENLENTRYQIDKHSKSITVIKMVGDGEVFYSPFLSKFLKQLNPTDFPKLQKIFLLTNGTLFTPNAYQRLLPGISYVSVVSVSIDAGTREVYQDVRGGDWDQLISNLNFISRLRKDGTIKRFTITFVTRKKNYKSMYDFVLLGEKLGVDEITFSAFHPWANMSSKVNYDDESIHREDHPYHHLLVQQIKLINERHNKTVAFKFDYNQ